MATTTLTVRRNKDGTLTVKCGRAVEYISIMGKTHGELFDAVKYAAISKGHYMPDVELAEMLSRANIEAA